MTAPLPDPLPRCPACGADRVRVAEDVSDEVTVLACDGCAVTWGRRRDDGPVPATPELGDHPATDELP